METEKKMREEQAVLRRQKLEHLKKAQELAEESDQIAQTQTRMAKEQRDLELLKADADKVFESKKDALRKEMIAEVEAALEGKRRKIEELLDEQEANKKELAQQQKKIIEDSRTLLEREEAISQMEDTLRSNAAKPSTNDTNKSTKRNIAG